MFAPNALELRTNGDVMLTLSHGFAPDRYAMAPHRIANRLWIVAKSRQTDVP
jgi:hypothetical protein